MRGFSHTGESKSIEPSARLVATLQTMRNPPCPERKLATKSNKPSSFDPVHTERGTHALVVSTIDGMIFQRGHKLSRSARYVSRSTAESKAKLKARHSSEPSRNDSG